MTGDDGIRESALELRSEYFQDRGNLISEAARRDFGDDRLYYFRDSEVGGGSTAFWYFEWTGGPGSDGSDATFERVFHGWATDLDGVRHMWFDSEGGYLFYPNLSRLSDVFTFLHTIYPGR